MKSEMKSEMKPATTSSKNHKPFIIVAMAMVFLSPLISIQTKANSDFGAAVGVRSDSATSNVVGTTVGASTGFMAGAVGQIDIAAPFQVRTGFFYTSRSYSYKPAVGTSGTATFTYIDVPFGVLWKLGDFGGPFVGANVGLNVSSSCPSGTCTGVGSFPVGLQLGAQFKFAPDLGAALYYETMGAVMTGIDQPVAAVFQFIYMM